MKVRQINEYWRDRLRGLQAVDDMVKEVMVSLRQTGQTDETYVVFTSDNGYQLGEQGILGKNRLYEGSLQVPLVVRGPGIEPGTRDDTPVTLVDLVPTFLSWAGATPGRTLEGLPLHDVAASGRDTLLIQTGDEVADRTPGFRYRGVTTERYLFAIRTDHPARGILLDRQRDPHGLVNRYADPAYRAVRHELAARVRVLARCSGVSSCNRVFGSPPAPD